MKANEFKVYVVTTVYYFPNKSKLIEWLCWSIWGFQSTKQDMPKATGSFYLKTTPNSTAAGEMSGTK